MSATTIEWTDRVWNFLRGCSRVSEGCRNCYAERLAIRMSNTGGAYEGLVRNTSQGPRWTGKIISARDKLDEPRTWREPARVFVNSMSDLFHPEVMGHTVLRETVIDALRVMEECPRHIFQVLTKRPAEMREFFVGSSGAGYQAPVLPNLWLGTSVEDQESHDLRRGPLVDTPAAVHFLSVEPLLGPVKLDLRGIDWVIVGGESGHGARPMHPAWVRSIRDACAAAGVAFFFKQWGQWEPGWEQGSSSIEDEDVSAAEMRKLRVMPGGFSGVADADSWTVMVSNGKSKTGRQLDGLEHSAFPEVRHVAAG